MDLPNVKRDDIVEIGKSDIETVISRCISQNNLDPSAMLILTTEKGKDASSLQVRFQNNGLPMQAVIEGMITILRKLMKVDG